jgi:enterochelin esterase family protein
MRPTGWLLLVFLLLGLACSLSVANRLPAAQGKKTYSLGPDSLPQEGVPQGKLEGPTLFKSKIFDGTVRRYWVYVPAQYKADKPACVLVFQDGQRAVNPKGVLRVPTVMDNLIHKKEVPVTIGIFITPGHKGDVYDVPGTNNPNNRSIEYDSLGDKYARFVIEEMLPEVGKKYNLTKDPKGRAIGGASSGAICAFTVAWERPDEFRNVISLVGSFTDIRGGHVYPDLVKKADAKPLRVFIQDGVQDNRNPKNPRKDWHLQNQAMVAALRDKGYDMKFVFGEGAHSDDHGGAILPDILRWIWRDYPGVEARAVRVLLQTEKGDIEVELDAGRAPVTVDNFLRYVDAGFYDDGRFHRTVKPDNQPDNKIKIEVIQGGINAAKAKEEWPPIKLERTRDTKLQHKDGTISMARDGPDTATSDFFFCIGDQPELDFGGKRNPDGQGFAAFGKVVKGMDVVRQIQAAPEKGQTLSPAIKILKVTR